jgi:stage V sporulation protein D (sporulation-specific penicillin-binding protein)
MSGKRKSRFNKFPVRKINIHISKKLVGLFLVVILALVALAVRISYINISSGADYTRIVLQANQQQYGNRTIAYKRGDILDRNGNILATSERVYRLILDCSVVNYVVTDENGEESQPYIEPTVNALVDFFGLDEDEIYELLESDETKESQYQVLLTDVSMEEKEEFEEYTDLSDEDRVDAMSEEEYDSIYYINGIWFEDSYQRVYPQNSLACDLIGFTNSSNEADWGIEGYYSDVLNGTNGRSFGYFNSDSDVEQTIIEPENGNNVVSTCDINIQEIVRAKIEDFMQEYANGPDGEDGAKTVAVLVMDPDNAEILAMDSTGWYDLNDPRDLSDRVDEEVLRGMTDEERLNELNAMWRNYCISDAFEPGSTFKPVTVAAALETDVIQQDDTFVCDGYEDINGQRIRCVIYPDVHHELDVAGSLINSCNDVLMQMSYELGADNMLRYQSLFNFGLKTGIDLPGENSGILYDENTMGTIELATTSFGQGFTCTMVQEAAAIASLINGGYYYTPHVVKSITDSEGNLVENIEGTVQRQTVSQEISDFIRTAMGNVVEIGTGQTAKVEGYSIGGKTGTAQKVPRSEGKYLVSFMGFAPVDDPEVLVYVVIDEPNVTADKQGDSVYAQELAKAIFTELLPYMNIYPEDSQNTADTDAQTGVTGEQGIDNDAMPEPIEGEVDDTVLHGGNDIYTDGIENDAY